MAGSSRFRQLFEAFPCTTFPGAQSGNRLIQADLQRLRGCQRGAQTENLRSIYHFWGTELISVVVAGAAVLQWL